MKSPLGPLTLFADADALIAVEWGGAPDPAPTPVLREAVAQLEAYFRGHLTSFELPLRLPSSPFQRAVWVLMGDIPYGATRTYGDLARELDSAPRAVGGACGRNPIPIIVPCHRVLGAGGRMAGYSGGAGVETKQALLRLEGVSLL
ncbi:MAG TPA: methylated-DNA--[protein]-cysteine S-methyltransferase [Rhodospirillales bacterium]|jgi:methylated-DNA-[protein]-cysteine S-methyltransferase|nr:methylated-DNA--[protein]-cysteine S-methyltransferase [Rhodospirillales bacterium]